MGRARQVALVALVAALAAGCGDAPTAKFAPPSSAVPSDPTTTAAADVTPPVMPELAKEHTVAGAKAFVDFVVATLNYSQSTLDDAPLRRLFSSGCNVCKAAPETVVSIRNRHGSIAGGEISASDHRVDWLRVRGRRLAHVTFTYHSTRQTVRFRDGKSTVYRAGRARTAWTLSPRASGWLVIGWDAA